MPSKRRKAADSLDASEPKRRVTRSSTAKTTNEDLAGSELPKPTQKASKVAKSAPKKDEKSASKKAGNAKSKESKLKDQVEPSEEGNGFTTLTISHDSVKNPIPCHQYNSEAQNGSEASTLIFTHGAGGGLSAAAVVTFCTGYSRGGPILAFQGPMHLPSRTKSFHACISHQENNDSNSKALVLGGRSMGARAAVIAAAEHLATSKSAPELKLILVSYPLKGPKDDIRDQILMDLPSSVKVLFIIGDRDAMCPLDVLEKVRKKMDAQSQLVIVKGADHGMHVKGKDREKKMGEESGIRAFDWVSGKLVGEAVTLEGELDE